MGTINADIFQKFKNHKSFEIDGGVNVDVREDEEQSVKFQEIIDLLLAAGYFRARIKGLSPFDKVVGGMTWCIESCNVDVDVDLLFQENSTIGQKIGLTEKIVAVLPKMNCPHLIEPHQIQGLDFIHIFPVIQWLVKRSMEFRQEMSEFVRIYAVNQFNKQFGYDIEKSTTQANILKNANIVQEMYRPRRYYKRKNVPPSDIETQVQITLLEYGYKGAEVQKNTNSNAENILFKQNSHKQQQLLNNLTLTKEDFLDYDDLNEEDLQSIAKHYAVLQSEFKDGGTKSKEEKKLFLIDEQIKILDDKCVKLDSAKNTLEANLKKCAEQLQEVRQKQNETTKQLKELEEKEIDENNLKEVEELLLINDNLKSQETQFKEYCKKELKKLQNSIQEIKSADQAIKDNKENDKATEELSQIVKSLRLQLAKKNRIVSVMQRRIDDVPNRPELGQYQRRFLELYNQVSAKHKETKQYYSLYNTLEDTRLYMQKELSLLNSISDNYPEAMTSNSGKEDFLRQFHDIVEGVKQSKLKVERRLTEEKRKRDQLISTLQILIEQQRKYVLAVRNLTIECKRHEQLSQSK